MTRQTTGKLLALLALALVGGERPGQAEPVAPSSDDATIYSALLAHYLHQDSMLWSRVQLLIAIQAGVLAGSVALSKNGYLAACILVLGAFFTLLLLLLVKKDELDRDVDLPLLDALARRIAAATPQGLRLDPETPIRLASKHRPWHVPLRGRTILLLSIVLLLIIDVLLASGYLAFPETMATFMGDLDN